MVVILIFFWTGLFYTQQKLQVSNSLQELILDQQQGDYWNLDVSFDLRTNKWNLIESQFQSGLKSRQLLQDQKTPLIVDGQKLDASSVFVPAFEAVIGEDERTKVETPQKFPHSTIGKLFMDCPCRSGRSQCTGTLIGPRTVLTAGHCVYDVAGCLSGLSGCCQQPCTNIEFFPSYPQGNTSYKVISADSPTGFIAGFMIGQDLEDYGQFDIAVLELEEDAPNDMSTLPYGFVGCIEEEMQLYIAGYPDDLENGEYMYSSLCRKRINTCSPDSIFFHECDTERGMSGSSIWAVQNDSVVIIGVHSRAQSHSINSLVNIGVLMNRNTVNYVQSIIKNDLK